MRAAFLALLTVLMPMAAIAQSQDAPPPGSKYVALGSSFASGPGVTVSADTPPNRCGRSKDNYPHQLARKRGLSLTDVSCSGATTAHVLGPWAELPPQIEAVDAQTRLVTITIGGNDVHYSGGLIAMGCHSLSKATDQAADCGEIPAPSTDKDWRDLETHMRQIVTEVRARAPHARLVLVDYIRVLPPQGTCAAIALTAEQADIGRAIDRRVVEITRRVAEDGGAELLTASQITADHHACSADPWVNGFPPPRSGVPFHPKLQAHTAVAEALDTLIWK